MNEKNSNVKGITELSDADTTSVFGGSDNYSEQESSNEIVDEQAILPSDPSRRKKKRLKELEI